MRRTRHAGFTLVELLVVLAIIAAMVAISVPAMVGFVSPKETLRKEGRRVMALMNDARQVAMSRKVRMEIRIDPAMNGIRAVESHAYRSLMANYPGGAVDRDDVEWAASKRNLFEKAMVFNEELMLQGFTAEEIEAPVDEDEIFTRREPPERDFDETGDFEAESVALAFTQFGGSDGGGITLYFKDQSISIAADILTGRPKVVNRRVSEP